MEWNVEMTKYLIPLGASLAGTLFAFVTYYFWQSGREFRADGVTAKARVLQKIRKPGGLENHWAVVAYTDTDNINRTAEVKVASRAWHSLREGETTSITYLAAQPSTVSFGPKGAKQLIAGILLWMVVMGAVLALVGLGSFVRELIRGVGS